MHRVEALAVCLRWKGSWDDGESWTVALEACCVVMFCGLSVRRARVVEMRDCGSSG